MKKSNTEKPISTEIKLDRKNKRYNFKFTRIKKGQKKYLESSPEKECSSINELVKRSVEKINIFPFLFFVFPPDKFVMN